MKTNKKTTREERIFARYIYVLWVCLFLTGSLIWAASNFGAISMEEIVFTLSMSLDGSGSGFIGSFIGRVLLPSLAILIAARLILHFIVRKKQDGAAAPEHRTEAQPQPVQQASEPAPEMQKDKPGKTARRVMRRLIAVWMLALLVSTNMRFKVLAYMENQISRSSFIEENYVDPKQVQLTFPENKRNLIWILLESGETSAQDIANGGLFEENYIPEMTRIAEENVSFSQSDQIEGALSPAGSTWTVGAMVSQFSGVPLKVSTNNMYMQNRMDEFESFMPGMTNLGDILLEQGYQNYFMIGSKASFGGRDKLMTQHGNYEIWDYDTAVQKGKIPPDYFVWWGYEDQKLYEYAKEELTRISQQDKPFNFTMLTVDTHHVDGWKCPLCRDEYDTQYANVWACASRQVNDFVNWCKEQPFYENTTIIITGDHCSMDPNFYSEFPEKDENELPRRKVYNAFVNSAVEPVQEKNRKFTVLDMFPSALAAMGVEIEGDRLALGANLFSAQKTLCEEYGYRSFFSEIRKKSNFYNKQLLYP